MMEMDLIDWIDWEDTIPWLGSDWLYYYNMQYCLFNDEENL